MAATYFSQHYQSVEGGGATAQTTGFKPATGVSHGRLRAKVASFVFPAVPAAGDILYLFKIRSSDRPLRFSIANHALAASGAAYDIGLRKENQGALIGDADDVVDGFVASGASDKLVDVFGSGTNSVWQVDADEFDVGRPLWQIMGQAADPGENWEFYCTVQAAGTTPAVGGIVFVLEYLAGD